MHRQAMGPCEIRSGPDISAEMAAQRQNPRSRGQHRIWATGFLPCISHLGMERAMLGHGAGGLTAARSPSGRTSRAFSTPVALCAEGSGPTTDRRHLNKWSGIWVPPATSGPGFRIPSRITVPVPARPASQLGPGAGKGPREHPGGECRGADEKSKSNS